MSTVVDLCNLSLSKIGDSATLTSIDPPEGSAQADHCARFYPMARDEALEAQDWTFASIYADITALDETNPRWSFVYSLPADCLVVRELVYTEGSVIALDLRNPQFEMGTIAATGQKVLFTHAETVSIRYTRRVVDPTKFSPQFTMALVYLLASHLAGAIIKGKSGVQTAQAMYVGYEKALGKAGVIDANQNSTRRRFVPDAMRARAYGGRETIIEQGQERYSLPFWAE